MKDHLWNNRVLVFFSPDKNNELFSEQLSAFRSRQAEMKDRELVVYQIFQETGIDPLDKPVTAVWVNEWRKRWRVEKQDFCLVLIGKDGSTKYKTHEKMDPSLIFDLIDSMPMRKAEIRGN